MTKEDKLTPGIYYFGAIIGEKPSQRCIVSMHMLHADGHLEECGNDALVKHLHKDATEQMWPRLAGSPEIARAIASRIMQ